MPLDYEAFKKLVKAYNCHIVAGTKHRSVILDKQEIFVTSFAIHHSKGSKDFIHDCYVRDFKRALAQLQTPGEEQP